MSFLVNSIDNVTAHANIISNVDPESNNESKEVFVVSSADAVVKPVTMMIEFIATSVTRSTVLGSLPYKAFAYCTLVWAIIAFESFTLGLQLLLQSD